MTTEDYVSFEVAKLLKKKGFDETVRCFYDIQTEILCDDCVKTKNSYTESIAAPTLQMATKWLREVHNIEIRVIYDNDKLCWYGACNPMGESQILLGFGRKCKSYEEACEAAIKYCLENLI